MRLLQSHEQAQSTLKLSGSKVQHTPLMQTPLSAVCEACCSHIHTVNSCTYACHLLLVDVHIHQLVLFTFVYPGAVLGCISCQMFHATLPVQESYLLGQLL